MGFLSDHRMQETSKDTTPSPGRTQRHSHGRAFSGLANEDRRATEAEFGLASEVAMQKHEPAAPLRREALRPYCFVPGRQAAMVLPGDRHPTRHAPRTRGGPAKP